MVKSRGEVAGVAGEDYPPGTVNPRVDQQELARLGRRLGVELRPGRAPHPSDHVLAQWKAGEAWFETVLDRVQVRSIITAKLRQLLCENTRLEAFSLRL